MTTNNDDTDNMLKNQQNFNILSGNVKSDDINVANNVVNVANNVVNAKVQYYPNYESILKCKLPDPKDFYISFRFADGEEAVFKNAKSLQEFIDKMNNYHELEKENKQLKDLLKKCRVAFKTYADEDETCGLEEENKYAKHLLVKIDEVLK